MLAKATNNYKKKKPGAWSALHIVIITTLVLTCLAGSKHGFTEKKSTNPFHLRCLDHKLYTSGSHPQGRALEGLALASVVAWRCLMWREARITLATPLAVVTVDPCLVVNVETWSCKVKKKKWNVYASLLWPHAVCLHIHGNTWES